MNRTDKKQKIIQNDASFFDENGKHILPPYPSHIVRTEVEIDFWEECFRIFLVLPEDEKKANGGEMADNNLINGKTRQRIIFKHFKVSEDFSVITIDDFDWYVPTFINKDALKEQDKKTWEIIFYYLYRYEVSEIVFNTQQRFPKRKRKNKKLTNDDFTDYISLYSLLYWDDDLEEK